MNNFLQFLKKQGIVFYTACGAAVLSLAGVIVSGVASSTHGYAYVSAGLVYSANILAILSFVLMAACSAKFGDKHVSTVIFGLLGVFLATSSIGLIVSERAELVSSLFSYASTNTVGWNVFYISLVAMILDLVAAVSVLVCGFLPGKKNKECKA